MSKLTISLPKQTEPYEHDIRRFVDAMTYKLKVHSGKGRWEDGNLRVMLEHLRNEVTELEDAINEGNLIEILTEAADVANFAMIISSIATEKGNDGPTRQEK